MCTCVCKYMYMYTCMRMYMNTYTNIHIMFLVLCTRVNCVRRLKNLLLHVYVYTYI